MSFKCHYKLIREYNDNKNLRLISSYSHFRASSLLKMEVEKLSQGNILDIRAKQIILNVFTYHRNLNTGESVTSLIDKVSAMTGVCSSTIYKIRKEAVEGGLRPVKKSRKRTRSRVNSRKFTYNNKVRNRLRAIVHSFFFKNIPPTLNKVFAVVKEDKDLLNMSRSTMWRILHEIDFVFCKRGVKSTMIERPEIVKWRHQYLRQIRKLRSEGYTVVYLDETWVNIGHSVSKEWKDLSVTSARDAFVKGLSTGLKQPTQRGPRFVIVHAGSELGFVEGAAFWFLAKKNTTDYHDEMDGPIFEQWFTEKLLPNLPEKTVIVMDNASYHSRREEVIPTNAFNKDQIKTWLLEKNIFFEEDYLKSELMEVVNTFKKEYIKYKIDEMCKEKNIAILRLPPYHCELNPIEMVWSQVKRHIAAHNTEFKTATMEQLIINAFGVVTVDNWKNYCKHVIKEEEKFWVIDGMMDDIDPVVINVTADSDSDDSDSDNKEDEDDVNISYSE